MRYLFSAWILLFCVSLYKQCYGWGSGTLDGWTMGTNEPVIEVGERFDGTTGPYIKMPVGTSPFFYEVMTEGEGCVTFYVYDPGNCLENPDPGYGTNGPRWGFQNPLYQSGSVGVGRPSYVSGCLGYSPWSTVDPYSFRWFKDGLRGSKGVPWTAGWYKWTICGTWDNLSFTIHNVTYYVVDKPVHDPGDEMVTGDYTGTFDKTSFGGSWEALFGGGWKAFWLRGDDPSGIEEVLIDIIDGTGIFAGVERDPPIGIHALPERVVYFNRDVVKGPNPYNPSNSKLVFNIPRATIGIYNLHGELVCSLGEQLTWDGRDHAGKPVVPGLYFYRAVTDNAVYQNTLVVTN